MFHILSPGVLHSTHISGTPTFAIVEVYILFVHVVAPDAEKMVAHMDFDTTVAMI